MDDDSESRPCKLSPAIASDAGDPILNAAILAWTSAQVPWTDAWFQFPIFHPAPDALTLSEHLLGISMIATPIYWMTGNPLIAYNLTLLLVVIRLGLRPPELLEFRAADGVTPLYGMLHFPPRFDAARRYPLLVSVYAGPGSGGACASTAGFHQGSSRNT